MTAVVLAFDLLLFYCQTAFGSGFSSSEANNMHQMFHIIGVKIPQFFRFFFLTSPCIRGNLIFHISFWFVDVITRDAGSHATGRPSPLISLTTTNYKWRTTERNIERFHGNWHNCRAS